MELNISYFAGITRLPILEGEVSHVEIPRTSANLGITIVGGSDTPLRCVVVQEVFPDGLVASDGRLQPGDQIIEINGTDMTCATHAQVSTVSMGLVGFWASLAIEDNEGHD